MKLFHLANVCFAHYPLIRLAMGSPGCLFGLSYVTKSMVNLHGTISGPKMKATYQILTES